MLNINGGLSSAQRSVIGTTSDDHTYGTLFGKIDQLEEHIHSVGRVIPTLANGITVSSCVAAWTLGAKVSLGTSVIASDFDFHYLNVESASDADTHEMHIFAGATTVAGSLIGQARFTVTVGADKRNALPLVTPLQSANQKTFARLANLAGAASTAVINLKYHTY